MPDTHSLLLGVAALLCVGLVVAVVLVLTSRRGMNRPVPPDSPGQRLALLARQRPDYRILVGVPPTQPTSWGVASRVSEEAVTIEGRGDISLAEVRAFIVAYPNGQMVDGELAGLPVPAGLTGLNRGLWRDADRLQLGDLEEGQKYVEVRYGPSELNPKDRNRYSTTLKNVSRQKIRILKFAGYARTPEGWGINTVTGTFYSGLEFREWYGLGGKEWLEPGEAACDPNNYGGPPVLWAYYCQAEDGGEFVAGGVLE